MIHRPTDFNPFEFVILSGLRAAQLMRGCIPRVPGTHKVITTAQLEVAEGKVLRAPNLPIVPIVPIIAIDPVAAIVTAE